MTADADHGVVEEEPEPPTAVAMIRVWREAEGGDSPTLRISFTQSLDLALSPFQTTATTSVDAASRLVREWLEQAAGITRRQA